MARRHAAVIVSSILMILALTTSVLAQGAAPTSPDGLRAYSIVPPGQEGEVTLPEFISGNYGAHYSDQLPMYSSLVKDEDVTDSDLGTLFHSMQFGPGATVESEYVPTEGATVFRDGMGVPHIYADDLDKAAFALGYVTAEDRMWEMDVFRHAGRGTLTELLGPGVDNAYLEMDIATRREGYTQDEIRTMFDRWDNKFGALGDQLQAGLRAYADGINQYITELQTNPQQCAVEYGATGNPCPGMFPSEWNVSDTLFLVVLQLRLFGETAGAELENAGFYAHLRDKLGKKLGARVYKDFLFTNDRRSPTTISRSEGRYPSQNVGKPKKRSFAIPDKAQAEAEQQAAQAGRLEQTIRSLGLPTGPASNALVVAGSESRSGNPLQIGAPQVGYANPSFFLDVDVHVPSQNIHYRGPAVPAASTLIPLGRGADYAWTLTTGFSDAVDVKIEKLCEPEGGAAKKESNGYVYKGKCRKMKARTETFTIKGTPPPPGTENPPSEEERTFYRTMHGPVFERGMVNGKPVAFVRDRYFWKKELDSIAAFYKWNTRVRNIKDFRKAASEFSMNFNAFYADANDIGWFHVGYLPKRPRGMHPSLPTWGTGRWEFKKKRFPFRRHPQVINPDQGWISNWNNKPAVGWDNTDHCCGGKWGSVQRVSLLQDQMSELLGGAGKAELSDLVDVIRIGATQDTRGVYLGSRMLKWANSIAGSDQKLADAHDLVKKWVNAGAHRYNKNEDDQMDESAALALFDEWWELLVHRVYDDEIGKEGYDLLRVPLTDYSPTGGSSFFFDFASYLKNVFDAKTKKKLAVDYCNDRSTPKRETCKSVTAETFKAAYDALVREQGANTAEWTLPAENIVFQELGAGSADPIPWQNRGTHNHVVEVLRDLNLPYPKPGGSGSPSPSPSGS